MITYTYDRRRGEMITPCPFEQRVSGILHFTYGQGDIVMVGSNACSKCPNFIADTLTGIVCKREEQ